MEPDHDKILSLRVRNTEQTPVTWNKTGVWEKVAAQSSPTKPLRFYYYAAAAAVTLVVLLVYAMQLKPSDSYMVSQNTASTEENIMKEQHTPLAPTETIRDNAIAESPAPAPVVMETKQEIAIASHPHEQHVTADVEHAPDSTQLLADIPSVDESIPSHEEPVLAEAKKIEPIIGVYYPVIPTADVAQRKKKTRLLKSDPVESGPWDDDFKNRIVIARTK